MKIATKLTKKVAEFVNENKIWDKSEYICGITNYEETLLGLFHFPSLENHNHYVSLMKGYTEVSEQEFIDMVTAELAGKTDKVEIFNPQPHYNNDKGSLYKIAAERNWNAYVFDIVKAFRKGW